MTIWLCALLGGCDALLDPVREAPGEDSFIELKLVPRCAPPGTRSARDPGPDDTVLNGVVLEFDAAGTLLEMQPFSEGYMPVLKVRKHQELNIYVVANPTVDFRSVSTLEEFLSMQSQYKSNSQGCLEMLGHFQGSFTADAEVTVPMQRMVCKIQVDRMVFRIASTHTNYTGWYFTRGYMEKTPATCGYDLSLSGNFVNSYSMNIAIGCNDYSGTANHYTQGEYKVWEYSYPWSVYCYPNASGDQSQRNILAVSYRLLYLVPGTDLDTGESIVIPRYTDACFHIVLPPLRQNTIYELEELKLNGIRNGTVYLKSAEEPSEIQAECIFSMTDMTSGEFLGLEKGEVRYE